ncbi:MAG TPA: hypothetical protein VF163_01020 [Micromonosporaceae bacterium]
MSASTPTEAPARIDYDGRRFAPISPHAGAANPDASVGHYHQSGNLIWAEFSGTSVAAGRLVGTCRPDGTIDATYCMVTSLGETVAGACVSTPTLLADGRVRLTEHWRRLDGSSGVSNIEEVC